MSTDKLQEVQDILAIQAVKAFYCESVDSAGKDSANASLKLTDMFAEDVKSNYGIGVLEGREAVINFLVNMVGAGTEWSLHAIHSPRVEVNGDTAVGHWTAITRSRRKGADTISVSVGRYRDEFRRTRDGWCFTSIHFIREG